MQRYRDSPDGGGVWSRFSRWGRAVVLLAKGVGEELRPANILATESALSLSSHPHPRDIDFILRADDL